MVDSINKSSNISNQPQISEVREKIIIEPKDSLNIEIPSFHDEKTGFVELAPERLEEVKKHMEKQGFAFNADGFASSIIYSAGIEHKLCDAEKVVLMLGGKVTGSLWLLNAFTAELTPSVYSYMTDNMPGYAPCPDRQFKSLIKPMMFCIPDEE
jgi:hypothetical protein